MVDEAIMGNVLGAGQGQNVARQAAGAGIPVEVPCMTVNKVCGSGWKSVILAAQAIAAGDADIVVAGGTENMNMAPYLLPKARTGYRMGHGEIIDSMIHDGLWCIFGNTYMGITAENVAERWGIITREEQDAYGAMSQNRAEEAIKSGRFKDEIVPVEVPQRKGDPLIFEQDEHRSSVPPPKCRPSLRPASKDGTVTAGNASGINDSAAAVVVMSAEKARNSTWSLWHDQAYASAGVEPEIMGTGPVPATKKALKGRTEREDIDLIEPTRLCLHHPGGHHDLGLDTAIVNVNGGAIALGHPIGSQRNQDTGYFAP